MRNMKTEKNNKNNVLKKTIITGALCTALVVPSFAYGRDVLPTSARDIEITPISYKLNHWAEMYIEQLSENIKN